MVATPRSRVVLRPEHVITAVALPLTWDIPSLLWHAVRAILSWLIWKDCNSHVFGGEHFEEFVA